MNTNEKWLISLKAVVWFVMGFLFLLALPLLLLLPPVLLMAVGMVALLVALLPYGWLRWRARRQLWGVSPSFFRCVLVSVLLVGILLGLPVYYLSYRITATPAIVPNVVLSNGEKTVVFQGMMHVGAESFYKSVVYDLEDALSQGYRLYYEGVQPSTPEADQWFSDKLAGGRDLSSNYKAMAQACGMAFQIDYFAPLARDMGQHPERHLTADVTTLQMKQEYDRLMASDPGFAERIRESAAEGKNEDGDIGDIMASVVEWQKNSSEGQRHTVGIVCRGVFSMVLGAPHDAGALAPVVLDFRNRHLVDTVLADTSPKIYITYGAEHLKGVLALLQERDPRWKVKSVKWSRAIANPEHFEREL
ncbi:MAG: hypothetical protein Q8J78_05605 [Moraxellaceae bacterium]|nr:hypothetical protein [Moraxellaceae bacterium]